MTAKIIKNKRALPNNWDGFGAVAVNKSVQNNAREFLTKLDYLFLDCLEEEDMYSTPYGTVVLDFQNEKGMVSVEVGESKIGFFTDFTDKALNSKSAGDIFIHQSNISNKLQKALKKLV